MDFWELAVQRYIARDRGVFFSSQYLVGERNGWKGEPDFLAIDFEARLIWFVEVTTYPRKSLLGKLDIFAAEYKPLILDQLTRHKVIKDEFQFGIWIFAHEAAKKHILKYEDQLKKEKVVLRFTSLNEAVFPTDDPYRK